MKILLFVIITMAMASAVIAAPDIKLDLSLKKTAFEVGEAVEYDVLFTNTTSREAMIYISSSASGTVEDYRIEVTDESGKPVSGKYGVAARYGKSDPTSLPAGKSVTETDFLNQWVVLSKPGKYEVKAVWKPHVMPWPPYIVLPDTAEVEKSESATVSINVAPATDNAKDSRLSEAQKELRSARTPIEKRAAVRLLGFTLDPRAAPELVRISRQKEVVYEVESALYRLGAVDSSPELRADITAALLADLEKNGPSDSFAYFLARFRVPGEKAVPVLAQWLKTGNSQQKAGALSTLSTLDRACLNNELKPAVSSSLSDRDPQVRISALLVLANARYSGTISDVEYLATSDRDKRVKKQAVITLGIYGGDKAVPTLAGLLKDSDLAVNAIAALEMIGTQKAETALLEFTNGKGGYVSEQADLAIERIKARRKK